MARETSQKQRTCENCSVFLSFSAHAMSSVSWPTRDFSAWFETVKVSLCLCASSPSFLSSFPSFSFTELARHCSHCLVRCSRSQLLSAHSCFNFLEWFVSHSVLLLGYSIPVCLCSSLWLSLFFVLSFLLVLLVYMDFALISFASCFLYEHFLHVTTVVSVVGKNSADAR